MNIDINGVEEQSDDMIWEGEEAPVDDAVKIQQIHCNVSDEDIPKVSMEFLN